MVTQLEYGAKEVADGLHESLRSYIEAQYPIRDTNVIKERNALLNEAGIIGQKPYIETTPTYQLDKTYNELGLPPVIGETLHQFSLWQPNIGIFPRPYRHQAQALTAFFNDGTDLIVSTGTGSGKTETFLLPILGSLLEEATKRPASFRLPGCRALLLYPMNALVSDQMSRLRRLFGDERLKHHFSKNFARFPLFGMYTSRTPYPGLRDSKRDREYLEPLLQYYLALENDESDSVSNKRLIEELRARGRWPVKDLKGFFGEKGKPWIDRLQTQPDDSELLTRHEMQSTCPDILVTNYSMLEYMLLRPVERNLFQQTREWLASDERNEFLLVLDEAHMYRGVGGAEVAFLIRRLQARLGVPRERFRCILTSASLGSDTEVKKQAITFAESLTGKSNERKVSYHLILGQKESRPVSRPGTASEAELLANFDLSAFFQRATQQEIAFASIKELSDHFRWPHPPDPVTGGSDEPRMHAETEMRAYLYDRLYGFGPLEYLIQETMAHARAFDELASRIFPTVAQSLAEQAITTLLALGTYANKDDRTLLPTRAHLFFRGLPALYACINPCCDQRRYRPGEAHLLGRLYVEPRTHCSCSAQARVYELFSHRECGAAFLRVFGLGKKANFYWHEQGGNATYVGQPLDETLLFIEEPHPQLRTKYEHIWVDITTGGVVVEDPRDTMRYRECWRPIPKEKPARPSTHRKLEQGDTLDQEENNQNLFVNCPACRRRTGHKITNLSTKGEQPFANLVRSQFMYQPIAKSEDDKFPNGGRKVLLFSDGRQKAARLARDLPREVEFDSFRQALVLAIRRLEDLGYEPMINEKLYVAFVSVCYDFHLYFFDHNFASQEKLLDHMQIFQESYDGDLDIALNEDWRPDFLPPLYKLALLRQLADPYYSLYAISAAVVEPSRASMRQMKKLVDILPDEHIEAVVSAWIQMMLEHIAFNAEISEAERREIDAYFKPVLPDKPITDFERLILQSGLSESKQSALIHMRLARILAGEASGALYLNPSALKLKVTLGDAWWQCTVCGGFEYNAPFGMCMYCNANSLVRCEPDHPALQSQKSYFVEPLQAVLSGARPIHITAEEHTAQLSQRDTGVVYATTEEYELRFQDVTLGTRKPPVDILSCTTTMEVGIDIGSLIAIGLRNVPPQRENYQQRAGRAGRRGTALSTVVTYAQEGPHDNYYYEHPEEIISGALRAPMVKVDNKRLAKRHINSFLIQTFFHKELDLLPVQEQKALIVSRPHVMSALGTAKEFFTSDGYFSLTAFKRWITAALLTSGKYVDSVVTWLPDELYDRDLLDYEQKNKAKSQFVKKVASDLLIDLERLSKEYAYVEAENSEQKKEVLSVEDKRTALLDVLFGVGLLPSYAFPTDLCTFFVFDWDKDRVIVKERPQQSKALALSEYAPGRLLVINKQTYRVGGIYDEHSPGEVSLEYVKAYVSCSKCNYVREYAIDREGTLCPICGSKLEEREMLDPPGFSPEKGTSVNEMDRNQQFSYASVAQFPTPTEPDQFIWKMEGFEHLQYTYEQNRRLVVVNKGPENRGFCLCTACGAIQPEAQKDSLRTLSTHSRPFLIDKRTFYRKGLKSRCDGPLHSQPIYLGYSFNTDVLLLRFSLCSPIAYHPLSPWLHDALRTVAEAISLSSSRLLDIDPGELSANYRLVPVTSEESNEADIFVDVYLFDTASGGAGYAAEAGERLPEIIQGALNLLRVCPGNCEHSCTKCLRHYGNRFWHEHLDRHLAIYMLQYARDKSLPPLLNIEEQTHLCGPLKRFLELEGYACSQGIVKNGCKVPLLITAGPKGRLKKEVIVGLHQALLEPSYVMEKHPFPELKRLTNADLVLLNAYVVTRDLPTAVQEVLQKLGAI